MSTVHIQAELPYSFSDCSDPYMVHCECTGLSAQGRTKESARKNLASVILGVLRASLQEEDGFETLLKRGFTPLVLGKNIVVMLAGYDIAARNHPTHTFATKFKADTSMYISAHRATVQNRYPFYIRFKYGQKA